MDRITFYVDPSWRRKGLYTPVLFPFWGNPTHESSLFAKEMFDSHPFDTTCYGITENIEEADMVLAPYRHQWLLSHDPALLQECARVAKRAGLPLLLDGMGDIEYPVEIEHAIVLRIGGYRFIPEKGRIIVPPASDDLLERCRSGTLRVRPKKEGKPVVGFAGWAQLTALQRVRTIIKELPIRLRGFSDSRYRAMQKGVLWRERALDILRRSSQVNLNLKVRRSFSGTSKTAEGELAALREDFVRTVEESDYCLDVRGDANASTRLFEILSLGRIPVIVDTERNFPWSETVNYQQFSLRVDFRELARLPDIIAEFHARVTPEEFEDMQRRAREAFVRYFRIDAQMPHIVRELRKLI